MVGAVGLTGTAYSTAAWFLFVYREMLFWRLSVEILLSVGLIKIMVAVKEVIKISFCVFYIFSGSKTFKWCLGAKCYGIVVIKAEIAPWQADTGGSIAPTHTQLGTWRRSVVNNKLRPSYIRERTFTYCTGGWVGLMAGLEDKKYLATRQFVSRTFMLSRSPGEYCDTTERK